MLSNPLSRKELEEKILSKRQQIDFERNAMETESAFSDENRENPDVMEETKNFDDPARNAADSADLKSLRAAEQDLKELLDQLGELDKN